MATSPATRTRTPAPPAPRRDWREWARRAGLSIGITILFICGIAIILGAQLIINGSGMPGR